MSIKQFSSLVDSGIIIGSITNTSINKYAYITSNSNNVITLKASDLSSPCILTGVDLPVSNNDATNYTYVKNFIDGSFNKFLDVSNNFTFLTETISGNSITYGNVSIGNSKVIIDNSGNYTGKNIILSNSLIVNNKASIDLSGNLKATSMSISGKFDVNNNNFLIDASGNIFAKNTSCNNINVPFIEVMYKLIFGCNIIRNRLNGKNIPARFPRSIS